jgi:hypothetical protein
MKSTYEGESSRTAFQCSAEHDHALAVESEDSPLWKHCQIHHNEEHVPFKMEVTGIHLSAMYRLSDEIVRIKTNNSQIVLNSKNYWAQPSLVRVVALTGNSLETQVGDTGDTRQERRAARAAATAGTGSSPAVQRRRRRADIPAVTVRAATQPSDSTRAAVTRTVTRPSDSTQATMPRTARRSGAQPDSRGAASQTGATRPEAAASTARESRRRRREAASQ